MSPGDPGSAARTTRPGAVNALLAALGVYFALAATSILGTIAFVATDTAYGQDSGAYLGLILPATLQTALVASLPFAVGVFLAFWVLVPIAPRLRMGRVAVRGLLAAVIGAVAMLVVGFVAAIVLNLSRTDPGLVVNGDPDAFARNLLDAVRSVLPGTLDILIDGLVVVPLGALLLWGWLQSHPPKSVPRSSPDGV
jgi:hypothetical protein